MCIHVRKLCILYLLNLNIIIILSSTFYIRTNFTQFEISYLSTVLHFCLHADNNMYSRVHTYSYVDVCFSPSIGFSQIITVLNLDAHLFEIPTSRQRGACALFENVILYLADNFYLFIYLFHSYTQHAMFLLTYKTQHRLARC